jgi:hypothetical protein
LRGVLGPNITFADINAIARISFHNEQIH